jgi:hypothetical protein
MDDPDRSLRLVSKANQEDGMTSSFLAWSTAAGVAGCGRCVAARGR